MDGSGDVEVDLPSDEDEEKTPDRDEDKSSEQERCFDSETIFWSLNQEDQAQCWTDEDIESGQDSEELKNDSNVWSKGRYHERSQEPESGAFVSTRLFRCIEILDTFGGKFFHDSEIGFASCKGHLWIGDHHLENQCAYSDQYQGVAGIEHHDDVRLNFVSKSQETERSDSAIENNQNRISKNRSLHEVSEVSWLEWSINRDNDFVTLVPKQDDWDAGKYLKKTAPRIGSVVSSHDAIVSKYQKYQEEESEKVRLIVRLRVKEKLRKLSLSQEHLLVQKFWSERGRERAETEQTEKEKERQRHTERERVNNKTMVINLLYFQNFSNVCNCFVYGFVCLSYHWYNCPT